MSDENRIISRIWASQICCRIHYSSPAAHERSVLYILVHRNSYLYLLLPEIFDYFGLPFSRIPQTSFEDARTGQLLHWNLPIDVSYELYTDRGNTNDGYFDINLKLKFLSSSQSSQSIKAFQQQLASYITPPPVPAAASVSSSTPSFHAVVKLLEKHWRNIIKESCYILNGSSNIVMSMSLENSREFWNAALHHNSKAYEKHFRKLVPSSPANVPIKLYIVENNILQFVHQPNINRIFPKTPLRTISLQSLVDHVLSLGLARSGTKQQTLQLMAHGVQLPADSPLDELYSLAKYFDSFLHIVIKL